MDTLGHYSLSKARKGAFHFLFGKIASTFLNLLTLVVIVKVLTPADYGLYVTALAIVELALGLASGGLDWVSARYIPEYRVNASAIELRQFITFLTAIQIFLYITVGLSGYYLSDKIADFLKYPVASSFFSAYWVYFVVEATGRLFRDQILAQLLLQGRAQVSLVVKNITSLITIVLLMLICRKVDVLWVAFTDIGAALVSVIVGGAGAISAVTKIGVESGNRLWSPPNFRTKLALAATSYASYLCSMLYSPAIAAVFLTRAYGLEVTAAFGLARNLSDQIKKILPTELFMGVIRPSLIAAYAGNHDFRALNDATSLLMMISLHVVGISAVVVAVCGPSLVSFTGHGTFDIQLASRFLFLLVLVGAPYSHRRVSEIVSYAVSRPRVLLRANLTALIVPVLIVAGFWTRAIGPTFVVASLLVSELVYNLGVGVGLRREGVCYELPWKAGCKLGLACMTSWAVAKGLFALLLSANILLLLASSLVLTGVCIWVVKPLDKRAVSLLNSVIRKPDSRSVEVRYS